MSVRARSLVAASIISLAASALAQDRPIDGQRLVLKRSGTNSKLVFVSRDSDFIFPSVGGPNDPATGSPGGATIELFSQNEGQASLAVPAGAGDPGWTVESSPAHPRYKFRNPLAPGGISAVRLVALRAGRLLKVVAKDAGLPVAGAQGAIGIRITTGTIRNCARFAGSTIRRDEAGAFVASHATTAGLFDCSDASMNGVPPACDAAPSGSCGVGTCPGDGVCTPTFAGCQCISPSSPCGETAPVCSGTCPVGEECLSFGQVPFNACGCIPVGSTPCGSPGPPTCGGACPTGTACEPIIQLPPFGGGLGCGCAGPGDCGSGGVACPNGFACALMPPTPSCTPISCEGTYPTCGGTCGSGGECQPLKVESSPDLTICVCAVPAPCDAACGGYTCTGGDVCTVETQPSTSCSCGAP
jgi:hypothetical protein